MRTVLSLLLFTGCSPNIWMDDGYTDTIQPLFSNSDDVLSSPYLRDTTFELTLHGADRVQLVSAMVSSDDSVLLIGPTTRPGPKTAMCRLSRLRRSGARHRNHRRHR